MAGELIVEVRIGGAVDPALGQVFSQIEQQIGQLESFAVRIGEALRLTTQSALPLATAFKTANDTAAESAGKWQTALGDIGKKLSEQKDILPMLTKAYDDLGKAMGAARLPASGQPTENSARGKISDTSRTVLKSASSSVDRFANYEGIISKLVLQGEKDPKRWAAQREKVETQIARMTYGTSLSKTEASSQLLSMFNAGMDLDELVPEGRLAARFTDSQQVDEGVTAGLFRTLSNGQGADELERLLNQIIGQAGGGTFGLTNTAEAITRLLPQVGGAPADAVRLAAIIQQVSKKTGNYNDVLSASKALFLEYKREGGSSAADLGRYGQEFMPGKTGGPGPNYIEDKLEGRRQTLEWKQKERESSYEGVSIAVGDALAPIYSHWTSFMTKGANTLGAAVEKLSVVVTVLAGAVVAGAALLTALAAIAKGKVLLGAAKAVFGPQSRVLSDATKTIFDPPVDASGDKPGIRARTKQAAAKVGTLVPDALRPSKVSPRARAGGAFVAVVGSALSAADTYQNAESAKEKSEGYGEAAGALAFGLLGAMLGPVGAMAGGYIGGQLGKLAGRKIYETWGEGSEKEVSVTPPLAELPGADAGKLLTVTKAPMPGALLLKNSGETGGATSRSGQGAPTLAPVIPLRSAAIDSSRAALGQYGGEHALQAQRVAPLESGDVARSLAGTAPAVLALPEPGSSTPLSITATTPQHFAVSPNIAINVQGSVTDPAELVRVLQPEIQRMFNGFAAQANAGGQMYDRTDDLYGYA
ncbi:hypothetical protein [Pseudomonas sp. 5P_5.1_Bac1]|uniref:hypothetical protein n=1 Tax=Pseudomonas sp. 5P_5.1_Bac1 TaxID=2971616 RepID=UPI0021C9C950|nr:hypothetical protein [Pseudomonas sp. 5P_5.1_Bac1]MCU1722331.1 hypothetical protein [Pseudomonas sp. 5P_5.1_Bac1]